MLRRLNMDEEKIMSYKTIRDYKRTLKALVEQEAGNIPDSEPRVSISSVAVMLQLRDDAIEELRKFAAESPRL